MKRKKTRLKQTVAGVLMSGLLLILPAGLAGQETDEEIFELSPFEVNPDAVQGYITQETLGGSKIAKRLIDIPQMVSIVNREFIDDMLAFDRPIDSLKLYDPGIQNQGPAEPNYIIRGFRSNDHAVDGLAQRSLVQLPMSMVQSVEVVKGPAAMLYGPHASVGGYVNRNLVRPSRVARHKVGAVIGTDNYKVGYVDSNLPIPGHEWIQLRFNAEYLDREFAYNGDDFRETRSFRLAANFDFSPAVSLRVAALKVDQEARIQRAPLNPDTDRIQSDFSVSGNDPLSVSQEDGWFFQADLSVTPSEIFSFNLKYFGDVSKSANVFVRANDPFRDGYSNDDSLYMIYRQANWSMPFGMTPGEDVSKFGPNRVNHTVEATTVWTIDPEQLPFSSETLIGGTFEKEQRDQDRWDTRRPPARRVTYDPSTVSDTIENGGGITDMRDPDFGPLAGNPWFRADASQLKASGYIHEQLSLWDDMLQLIYGLRWDFVETQRYDFTPTNTSGPIQIPEDTQNNLPDFTSGVRDFSNISDRYGIIVQPIEGLSIYAGHSEAFQDNGPGAMSDGSLAPPQEIDGDEVGIKFDMFKGFSGSIAFFDIELTNRVTGDPDNPGFRVLDPNPITNDGWEASLAWQWESLTLLGGYYSGEAIDERNGQRIDTQFTTAWNFMAKYQFTEQTIPGLSIGAGVSYEGTKEGRFKGQRRGVENQPSATFFDAFIAYRHEDWIFRVAGNNLTDEYSIGNIIHRTRVGYGRPREVKFSVTYEF